MGVIRSRASKQLKAAEAERIRYETMQRKRADASALPWWRQPTLGDMIAKLAGRTR
jgi:hypothetical protein